MSSSASRADVRAGYVLVDKPVGPSSHSTVQQVRRALGIGGRRGTKAGHAGTLDPFASGLLVVLVGSATRLMPYVVGHDKRYLVGVRFGASSDTDDSTGTVVPTSGPGPRRTQVEAAALELAATTEQVPPAVSAIHVDGRRAYQRVRRGETVVVPARTVRFEGIDLVEWRDARDGESGPFALLDVRCGSGTYMRALARDLGDRVGCPAHCESLRRLEVGRWTVDEARDPSLVGAADIRDAAQLLDMPRLVLADDSQVAHVRDGRMVNAAQHRPGSVALLAPDRSLVAVAEVHEDGLARPRTVLVHTGRIPS